MATDCPEQVGAAERSPDPRSDEPLQNIESLSGGRLLLTKQDEEVLDETANSVEVVSHLDLAAYAQDDPFPDWHDSKPFEPMLRTLLLKELEGASDAAVHRTLDQDSAVATELGFDPDDVPDQSTLSRARRSRFEELQSMIEESTRQIRMLAARRGSPIGTPYTNSALEEPTGSSKRTINRLIRGKTREVVEELTSVVFPAVDFDRPDGAIYDDEELLLLETLLGITGTAANGGAETYGDYVNPEPDLDDPFFEDGPSGETVLTATQTTCSRT